MRITILLPRKQSGLICTGMAKKRRWGILRATFAQPFRRKGMSMLLQNRVVQLLGRSQRVLYRQGGDGKMKAFRTPIT